MFSTNNQNINTFQPRTICSIDDFCRKTPAHSPIQRTAEVFVKILLLLRQMDNVKKYGLKEQVALLPLSPGVYQFLDKNGTIIYVGKAKSLRKRVSSYFMQNKEHSAKVQIKTIVNNVVFPVVDVILAILLFVKIATSYMDYRKHGQFEWTAPAILFGCLIFSLTAPLYLWSIVGL